jgi:hypothetical protein
VAGEAVDEVVLAAASLVGDDDDVAPVREHGVAVAGLGGHELLDGREDDATAADAELLAQVGPVGRLDGILAQKHQISVSEGDAGIMHSPGPFNCVSQVRALTVPK